MSSISVSVKPISQQSFRMTEAARELKPPAWPDAGEASEGQLPQHSPRPHTWILEWAVIILINAPARTRTRDIWLWYHIELHAPTSSTQKFKLMGKGGQFTYTPTNLTYLSRNNNHPAFNSCRFIYTWSLNLKPVTMYIFASSYRFN
jgi:hypothetical protein